MTDMNYLMYDNRERHESKIARKRTETKREAWLQLTLSLCFTGLLPERDSVSTM